MFDCIICTGHCNTDSGDGGGKAEDDVTQTNKAVLPHEPSEEAADTSAAESGAREKTAQAAAEAEATRAAARRAAAASDNAAALLVDLIENGCRYSQDTYYWPPNVLLAIYNLVVLNRLVNR